MQLQPQKFLALGGSIPVVAGRAELAKNELATMVVCSAGALRLRVTGSSMLPAIRPGDVLRIRRCWLEDVGLGEVILFTRHRRLFAHRVVAHSGVALVTQGDSIDVPDPAIGADELLGKVVRIERGGQPVRGHAGLTFPNRILAALLRRSAGATHLLARLHALTLRIGL